MIESLLLVLPCAAMMGVMMYMMRGKSDSNDREQPDREHEVDTLRAEIDELRREHNTTGAEPERG